jgi:hypothetical protein
MTARIDFYGDGQYDDADYYFNTDAAAAMRHRQIRSALSDPYAIVPTIRQNTKEKLDEDLGFWDVVEAGATGIAHGFAVDGPLRLYQATRVLGSLVGSDSIVNWTSGEINEIEELRRNNPWYQPDPKWANSWWADSFYKGMSSIAASLESAVPGTLLAIPAAKAAVGYAAGASIFSGISWLAGTGSSAGIAGLSAYDQFLEEATAAARAADPSVTREQIESEQFWNAVGTGIAEAGPEFLGGYAGGRIAGIIGRGTAKAAGVIGNPAAQAVGGVMTRFMRNMTYDMAINVGEEATTAAFQDYFRKRAGLDYKGYVGAIKESIGPALFAGAGGGVVSTAFNEVQRRVNPAETNAGADAGANSALIDPAKRAAIKAEAEAQIKQSIMERALADVDPGMRDYFQQRANTEGMNVRDALAETLVAERMAQRQAETTGENVQDIMKGLAPNNPLFSQFVQAIKNPQAAIGDALQGTADYLWSLVPPEAQAIIQQEYQGLQEGTLAKDFEEFLKSGKMNEALLHPEDQGSTTQTKTAPDGSLVSVVVPNAEIHQRNSGIIQNTFEGMKNTMSDAVGALNDHSRTAIGKTSLTDMLGIPAKAPKAQAFSVNREGMANVEQRFKDADLSQPKNYQEYVRSVASAIDFDPLLSPGQEALNNQERLAQLFKQLDPVAERVGQERLVRHDVDTVRKAMEQEPMVQDFLKALGDVADIDKLVVKMNLAEQTLISQAETIATDVLMGNVSPEMEARWNDGLQLLTLLHAAKTGTSTELARGLRLSQYNFTKGDKRLVEKLTSTNKVFNADPGTLEAKARMLLNEVQKNKTADVVDRVLKNIPLKARATDALVQYVTSNMLTGIPTHLVNLFSNISNGMLNIFNNGLAEFGIRLGLMPEVQEGIRKGHTMAMLHGFWEGVSNFRKAFQTSAEETVGGQRRGRWGAFRDSANWAQNTPGSGSPIDSGTMTNAISGERLNPWHSSEHNRISNGLSTVIDLVGSATQIPFNALSFSDNFFKFVYKTMELNGRVWDAANGDAAKYAQLKKAVPRDIEQQATAMAKLLTFQEDYGKIGKIMSDLRNAFPVSRFFIPFLKTPLNVFKSAIRMTPIIGEQFQFVKDDLNSQDVATRQLAEARIMTGTMIAGTALMLAQAGYLTGPGPKDPNEYQKLLATGWRPNALRIGDEYWQLDRLDPLAFLLNSAAFLVEAGEAMDGEDVGYSLLSLIGQSIRIAGNRTYLSSLSDLMDVFTDTEASVPTTMRRLGGSLFPASSLARTIVRSSDPYLREVDDIMTGAMNNIPGASEYLPIRRDFLGQPIENSKYSVIPGTNGTPPWLSPFQMGHRKNDPVYEEVLRLHRQGLQSAPMPSRWVQKNGQRIKLDGAGYSRLLDLYGNRVAINGQTLYKHLGRMVDSPEYRNLGDEDRATAIKNAAQRYGRKARDVLVGEDREIQERLRLKDRALAQFMGPILQQ